MRNKWQPMYGESEKTRKAAEARAKRIVKGHQKDFGKAISVRVVKRKHRLFRRDEPFGLEFRM